MDDDMANARVEPLPPPTESVRRAATRKTVERLIGERDEREWMIRGETGFGGARRGLRVDGPWADEPVAVVPSVNYRRAVEALTPWLSHEETCDVHESGKPCSCGLDAAIADLTAL